MDYVGLARELQERYRRYLRTTFYFRDPELRQSFREALDEGRIAKGPYVDATPPYRRGPAPSQLFAEIIDGSLEEVLLQAVDGQRRTYKHQESALRRVADGRNVVVATGTGSGKTECFLYPILLHLYQEYQQGTLATRPGVRALILYPMNALAYDQRERLGRLAKRLEQGTGFRFTFGQYTGATPESRSDTFRHAAEVIARRLPGELVLREEMRSSPPHILLTNYSMLEYQLLRPLDSPLFDGAFAHTWKFLVVDEAHQYRGTRGNEMGLLLRRLKQRIRAGGNAAQFRCIATSASLAGGEHDRAPIADFASNLFDEPFDPEDVILAETESTQSHPTERLAPDSYAVLLNAMAADDRGALEKRWPERADNNNDPLSIAAGRILASDQRLVQFRQQMASGPKEIAQLANTIFGDLDGSRRVEALMNFTEALNRASDPVTGGPFLATRYHMFLRALEGAFIRYFPNKQILLAPQGEGQEKGTAFELALCHECGQHYLVGKIADGRITEAVRDASREDFGASFFWPVSSDVDVEAHAHARANVLHLCTRCGHVWKYGAAAPCSHDAKILIQEQKPDADKPDQISECVSCGYRGEDPVREVIHGGDGPHAMIASTLFERLDQEPKKILAFADSRQEAAYFAWYLDETYRTILKRNVLYRALMNIGDADEKFSLADIVDGYRHLCDKEGLFSEAASKREKWRKAGLDALGELLTPETRLSLSGVGLIRWQMQWPAALSPADILTSEPWKLSPEEAQKLTYVLVDSLRHDRAAELTEYEGVQLDWSDLGFQGSQRIARLGPPHGQAHVVSWNGPRGWRTQYLAKVLRKRGYAGDRAGELADRTLRAVWDGLTSFSDRQSQNDRLLISARDGRRLNPVWYRASLIGENGVVWRCDTCNRVSDISFEGICPRHGCKGTLLAVDPSALADNHYRAVYQLNLPGHLVVEEHTAQLTTERGQEVQREFQEGRVNVLSCSTTFELGVDLGDLNTIFLRNVPPEAFNYAQRVGRAGRRAGAPGFAITYCRRAPHDLYYFIDPLRLVAGATRPPVAALDNPSVARRHLAAVILAAFFRESPHRFRNVESLLGDWQTPTLMPAIRSFLESAEPQIKDHLLTTFPKSVIDPLGIRSDAWVEEFCGSDGRLARAETEVAADFLRVDELERQASEAADYDQARWAKRRKATISSEDVLSFLSRKAVIPKYGFPVDVVELDTQPTRSTLDVRLMRDLGVAIGEFAPTATLVASKREWQSFGLKKVPEKELESRFYRVCQRHNAMVAWGEGQAPVDLPCGDHGQTRKYVIPAFGFTTSNKPPRAPTHRPTRLFTTRPYFLGSKATEAAQIEISGGTGKLVTIWKAAPGRMAVLCEGRRGRNFLVCSSCGAGFLALPKVPHETAWGRECRGTLSTVALGHEFVTDVVQIQFLPPLESGKTAPIDPSWLSYSLATALLHGVAEEIDVPEADLNATVGRTNGLALPMILLYDAVPGGAGLVARVEDPRLLRRCLETALRRVSGDCGCGEDTSCYGCLRNYRNQFAHSHLARGPAKVYLERVLDLWNLSPGPA